MREYDWLIDGTFSGWERRVRMYSFIIRYGFFCGSFDKKHEAVTTNKTYNAKVSKYSFPCALAARGRHV